jgi:hypothetical protein
MTTLLVRVSAVLTIGVVLFLVVWILMYPSASDSRNVRYVLWKIDLIEAHPDVVAAGMIADRNREALVVGMTRVQIQKRFRALLPLARVSPYLRGCYEKSPWHGRDVGFIDQSPLMVVFEADQAVALVLCKGL